MDFWIHIIEMINKQRENIKRRNMDNRDATWSRDDESMAESVGQSHASSCVSDHISYLSCRWVVRMRRCACLFTRMCRRVCMIVFNCWFFTRANRLQKNNNEQFIPTRCAWWWVQASAETCLSMLLTEKKNWVKIFFFSFFKAWTHVDLVASFAHPAWICP